MMRSTPAGRASGAACSSPGWEGREPSTRPGSGAADSKLRSPRSLKRYGKTAWRTRRKGGLPGLSAGAVCHAGRHAAHDVLRGGRNTSSSRGRPPTSWSAAASISIGASSPTGATGLRARGEPSYQGAGLIGRLGRYQDGDGRRRERARGRDARPAPRGRAPSTPAACRWHGDGQSTFRERFLLDLADPSVLHDEITVMDHALTRPRSGGSGRYTLAIRNPSARSGRRCFAPRGNADDGRRQASSSCPERRWPF